MNEKSLLPWRLGLAIAVGGGLGSLIRWQVSCLSRETSTLVPTMVVNMTGCLVLGAILTGYPGNGHYRRSFLTIGLFGGLTTFSTVMVQLIAILAEGNPRQAMVYGLSMIGGGLVAIVLGARGMRIIGSAVRPWRTP